MRAIPQTRPGEVLVQCVWPAARGPKPDCRGDTGVIWAGHGDVKAYPADKWPLLAEHPDVWRLYDGGSAANAAEAVAPAQATQLEAAQAEVLRQAMARIRQLEEMLAKHLPKPPAEPKEQQVQNDLEERQQLAASRNTDLVAVVLDDDDQDAVDDTVGGQSGEVAVHRALQEPALMLTIDDLKAMPVEDVRQLANARSYMLNPRLRPERLYEQFLEMQRLRAEQKA